MIWSTKRTRGVQKGSTVEGECEFGTSELRKSICQCLPNEDETLKRIHVEDERTVVTPSPRGKNETHFSEGLKVQTKDREFEIPHYV